MDICRTLSDPIRCIVSSWTRIFVPKCQLRHRGRYTLIKSIRRSAIGSRLRLAHGHHRTCKLRHNRDDRLDLFVIELAGRQSNYASSRKHRSATATAILFAKDKTTRC